MLSMDPKSKWDLELITASYRGTHYGTLVTDKLTLFGEKGIIGRSIAVVDILTYRDI